jgi:hypothetical protein
MTSIIGLERMSNGKFYFGNGQLFVHSNKPETYKEYLIKVWSNQLTK